MPCTLHPDGRRERRTVLPTVPSLEESKRHVGAAPLELQYRESGPENVIGAIGSVRGRKM